MYNKFALGKNVKERGNMKVNKWCKNCVDTTTFAVDMRKKDYTIYKCNKCGVEDIVYETY